MAKNSGLDDVVMARMKNGYMVRTNVRPGDYCPADQCYVFNDYQDAANKVKELLGEPEEQV